MHGRATWKLRTNNRNWETFAVSKVRCVVSHGKAVVKLRRRVLLHKCEGVLGEAHDVLRAGRRRARPAVHRRGDGRAPPRGRLGAGSRRRTVNAMNCCRGSFSDAVAKKAPASTVGGNLR